MHNKTLTKQEVIKAIFDPEIRKEFPVIQSYLSASNLFINDSILNEIKAEIENELIESLRYFCYLYYYIMEQKNSWGDAGEQQVKVSFCRNLLDIDPDIDITEQDVNSFFIKVKTDLLNLGISKISLDELQKIFDEYSFRVLGKDFDINEVFILSDIILFAGSKLFLQGGLHGNEIQIILGNGTIQSLGEYSVIWLEKELVRSPNTIMAMAAIIGDKNIYIRKEALTAI
ncbi:MAG: hypothetical protein GY730_10825, partial [bacterium]|nr:hypothetical protein [bacterium]